MSFQGNGKIRLLARNGLFRDDVATQRYTELSKNLKGTTTSLIEKANAGSATTADVAGYEAQRDATDKAGKQARQNYYIEFDVMPDITESGSAMYAEASDIRAPSSILWYQGSPSRTFSLNAKLVARTPLEAARVSDQIHILKSWRMPEVEQGGVALMTPPTLLYLQGYGAMFKDIPVVMTELTIELSSEHDYIYAESTTNAVPIITGVSMSLREAHAVDLEGIKALGSGFKQFNILDYRLGRLQGW